MTSATTILPTPYSGDFSFSEFIANTRRLLPCVLLSVLLHLLWIWVLPPLNSASNAMTRQLIPIVTITPSDVRVPEIPLAVETQTASKNLDRKLNDFAPSSSTIDSNATSAEMQTTTTHSFVLPPIDVGALVRSAGAFARDRPTAAAGVKELNLAVSPLASAIAGAARNEVWVESRTSDGWITKNGKTTCVIAPHFVPYYMQGMLIVPQCTVGK